MFVNSSRFFSSMNRRVGNVRSGANKGLDEVLADALLQTNLVTPVSPLGTSTRMDLRRSGRVFKYRKHKRSVGGGVRYGGGSVSYAYTVHEMPEFNNWTEEGTGNKFIERPFRLNRAKWIRHIARRAGGN